MQINVFGSFNSTANEENEGYRFGILESGSTNTDEGAISYKFPQWEEVSTSISPWEYEMSTAFKDIMQYSFEEPEEESSPFIKALKVWIEKYGKSAVELTTLFMKSAYSNKLLNSDILEMLGDVQSQSSYVERLSLLMQVLNNPIPELRYGAVLGLGNMRAIESIGILDETLKKEKIQGVSNVIKRVLTLLKSDENGK